MNTERKRSIAPYGSWESPITAKLASSQSLRLSDIRTDGEDVYWVEGRPDNNGHCTVVRRSPDGAVRDITPPSFNVRSRVHTYGGAPYVVWDGTVYFSNFTDNHLYLQHGEHPPEQLTHEANMRFADMVVDPGRRRIICVCEKPLREGTVVNFIAAVSLADGSVEEITTGADFYSSPRLAADGRTLAWVEWNHPNMPWDGTDLYTVPLGEDGRIISSSIRQIASGYSQSIMEPMWGPNGELHFISDATGWWNPYRWSGVTGATQLVCASAAEFTEPHWQFGMRHYDFLSADNIICAYTRDGRWHVDLLDASQGKFKGLKLPYSHISDVNIVSDAAYFLAGSFTEPVSVVRLDIGSGRIDVIRRSTETLIDRGYISIPVTIEFQTEGGHTAYAFYYPPMNKDYAASGKELPPCLVQSHGGPTSAASTSLQLGIQYHTSRGLAVLDVNYGGSSGYGRAYRERLNDSWGRTDVADCINAVRHLIARGLIDSRRVIIRGGSASGYTVLRALTTSDIFRAGVSYYGIGDLEALARDTHKFESRYLDKLVGPYPEKSELYAALSPVNHLDRLSVPMLLFQGADDKVVPPNQAEMMAAAVRAKGLPVAHLVFEGEGHGFRKAATIERTLTAETYFYARVLGFPLPEAVEPIAIENMD